MLGGYSDNVGGLEHGLFNLRAHSGLEAGKDATRWYNPPLDECCFGHSKSLALNAKYDTSSFAVAFHRHCFDLTVSDWRSLLSSSIHLQTTVAHL